MSFIKKHWLIIIFVLFVLVFSVLFPDLEVTITGGLAWLYFCFSSTLGIVWIVILILGGELKYETKGLIYWVKELAEFYRNRKN